MNLRLLFLALYPSPKKPRPITIGLSSSSPSVGDKTETKRSLIHTFVPV
jgi:hypothetical protein